MNDDLDDAEERGRARAEELAEDVTSKLESMRFAGWDARQAAFMMTGYAALAYRRLDGGAKAAEMLRNLAQLLEEHDFAAQAAAELRAELAERGPLEHGAVVSWRS